MHYLEKWGNPRPGDMSLAQATTLAIRLLMTAAELDSATGGVHPDRQLYATLKLLSRDGIHTIATEEQARCWKETQS